ncbi:hypothetical protein DS909_06690 [Phaeobacter gallaeciensis]|uniref:Uncharacterized protein n=1 Tax=Phaeobacter gallaeciensis TaxID=60890 RepID=A0A366X325_9RHOB|nr:hypothetical protein DS909_06690 [Phaeobacter gallaeciensis]
MGKYFGIWSSIGEIETDFQEPYSRVAAWVRRGEIPRAYDTKLLQVATKRGFSVTRDQLDSWHVAHKEFRATQRIASGELPTASCPKTPDHPFLKAVSHDLQGATE